MVDYSFQWAKHFPNEKTLFNRKLNKLKGVFMLNF